MTVICFHCGEDIEIEAKVSRSEVCPKCSSAVKCCMNCRFYDKSAHNQCLEPAAEWISVKDRSNFCEYFEPSAQKKAGSVPGEAKKKWDSLFKK